MTLQLQAVYSNFSLVSSKPQHICTHLIEIQSNAFYPYIFIKTLTIYVHVHSRYPRIIQYWTTSLNKICTRQKNNVLYSKTSDPDMNMRIKIY